MLIVGAHGRLGSALAAEATRRGLPLVTSARTGGFAANLCSDTDLFRLTELAAGDTVIYCAQIGGRSRAAADPAAAYRVNAYTPAALARAAKRMIYVSSDYVFSTGGIKHTTSAPWPADVYAASKAEGERQVLAAGSHTTVVRTCGLYDHDTGPRGLFAALTDVDAPDNRTTSPTYLPDLVNTLLTLGERTGVVHVCGPDSLSEYEFHQLAALRHGYDVRPVLATVPRVGVHLQPTAGLASRPVADVFVPVARPDTRRGQVVVLDTIGVVLSGRRWREPDPAFWAEQAAGPEQPLARHGAARIVAAYAPNPRLWHMLRHLRTDTTYVLANNGPAETFQRWCDRYGFDRLFHHTLNSQRDQVTKPQPRFRDRIAQIAAGRPIQLIDDSPAIVTTAAGWGWTAVLSRRTRLWPNEHYTPEGPIL